MVDPIKRLDTATSKKAMMLWGLINLPKQLVFVFKLWENRLCFATHLCAAAAFYSVKTCFKKGSQQLFVTTTYGERIQRIKDECRTSEGCNQSS